MEYTRPKKRFISTILLCGLLLGAGGCDPEVAAQLAALAGECVGDAASLVTTAWLTETFGIEGDFTHDGHALDDHAHDEHADEGHAHDAGPLHDYEH
jgi:hypothetical protein